MRKKMSYGRKILEVFIQIGMLPVSAFITAISLFWVTIFMSAAGLLGYYMEKALLDATKGYKPREGYTYYVDPSVTASVSDDRIEFHYDDGKRYDISGNEFGVGVMGFFALPLRVISLALSVLALIIPPLCIKLKNNKGTFASIVFDII